MQQELTSLHLSDEEKLKIFKARFGKALSTFTLQTSGLSNLLSSMGVSVSKAYSLANMNDSSAIVLDSVDQVLKNMRETLIELENYRTEVLIEIKVNKDGG